jgi:hypothetical protein
MPLYEFQEVGGRNAPVEEFFLAASGAPRIGETWRAPDGRLLRRVFSSGLQLAGLDTGRRYEKYPYVSHQLPRWMEGVKCDRVGRPIIRSATHERKVAAKHGYVKL